MVDIYRFVLSLAVAGRENGMSSSICVCHRGSFVRYVPRSGAETRLTL